MINIGYGLAWIATSAAICYGIYMTQDLFCMWAFLFPASISMSISKKTYDDD